MARLQAVIFDFDYTLADSSRGIVECVGYALERMGLPPVAPDAVKATVGHPLPDMLGMMLGEEHAGRGDEFTSLFVERADEVMAGLTAVYGCVPEVLGYLRERGLRLGIVSTKFRYRIEMVLGRESLLEFFEVIVGGEDVARLKPNPESLLLAIEKLGLSPDSCLYVGDSVVDAEAAERAGVPFVAVLSGATEENAFSNFEPLVILDSVWELTSYKDLT